MTKDQKAEIVVLTQQLKELLLKHVVWSKLKQNEGKISSYSDAWNSLSVALEKVKACAVVDEEQEAPIAQSRSVQVTSRDREREQRRIDRAGTAEGVDRRPS